MRKQESATEFKNPMRYPIVIYPKVAIVQPEPPAF